MTIPRSQQEFGMEAGRSRTQHTSLKHDSETGNRRATGELSRRRVLGGCVAAAASGLAGAIGVDVPHGSARAGGNAAPAFVGRLDTTVKKVERIQLNVPYRDLPRPHMMRTRAFDRTYIAVYKVTLGCGAMGIGEAIQYRRRSREKDRRVLGRDAAEVMWDDTLGSGLQGALLDAVGQVNDVPIYRLLGHRYRGHAFVSWWGLDMPGEDWVKECQEAVRQGYTSFKTKARPWWDLDEQCRVLGPTLPDYFKVGIDFNSTLLDSSKAVSYCRKIEKYDFVANFETPIPQGDIPGNEGHPQSDARPHRDALWNSANYGGNPRGCLRHADHRRRCRHDDEAGRDCRCRQ